MKPQQLLWGLMTLFFFSCTRDSSPTTGWDYNNPKNGGFQKAPFVEQETGPGLVLIEGGTFEMYLEQDSIISDKTMKVVVPSYYLDEKEVTNFAYCEYLYWLKRTFSPDFPLVHMNALPDTLCWANTAGNNQSFIKDYLRHPSYANYPVVGVSWMQANNYCAWRTDRVNEFILIREGILLHNPNQQNEPFTTGAYLAGQYDLGTNPTGQLPDLNPSNGGYNPANGKFKSGYTGRRMVRREDGILLPNYRLPTEAEWEYAASAGVTIDKKQQKKLDKSLQMFGQFINPMYAEKNEFNTHIVMPVDAFLPNDFGIYNMTGNVSEWVADVYIERNDSSTTAFSPFVQKEIEVPIANYDRNYLNKLDEVIYDIPYILTEVNKLESEMKPSNDSLLNEFLEATMFHLEKADSLYGEKMIVDASRQVRSLTDDFFAHYFYSKRYNGYYSETSPKLLATINEMKRIFATSIIDTPGNIQYEGLTPDSRIRLRNNGTWHFPNYDSIIKNNDLRVFKGPNWLDSEKWVAPSFRRYMNKYETSALVGFRCAMDRVGSPVGLSKKKKK